MEQSKMKALFTEAWKEVFKVEEVSDDADFFEAGGDSIKAVQLSAWLIQKGIKLDLVDVFMTPHFNELAEKLVEAEPVYVPDAMLTKEIAAKEMGFASVEEAEAAEKMNLGLNGMGNQQVCTPSPMGEQQVCTPSPMGEQQVCTPSPMGNQQVCTPGSMGDQQVCTPSPMGNQQVCTPSPMGNQQVCTPSPMGNQQVCTPGPMGNQQICTPMMSSWQGYMPMGNQQICTPMMSSWQGYMPYMPMGNQQICTPMMGSWQGYMPYMPMGNQQICTPAMGNWQNYTPMGSQQVCTPSPMGNQQVCTPGPMGSQQVCTPSPMGSQQICTPGAGQQMAAPMGGAMVPPQIQKYLSHSVEQPIEKPNVIKIEKAQLKEKVKTPEDALMDVMNGLLPNFNKEEDFFVQGLTSLDTVKMVTRCGEAGYELELKDIYMHSNFNELVKCMK